MQDLSMEQALIDQCLTLKLQKISSEAIPMKQVLLLIQSTIDKWLDPVEGLGVRRKEKFQSESPSTVMATYTK
jgi:hypothetical protein